MLWVVELCAMHYTEHLAIKFFKRIFVTLGVGKIALKEIEA